MKIVYVKATSAIPTETGATVLVREGEHWPADDPVVINNPHLFTDDPTVGLSYTVKPTPDTTVTVGTTGARARVEQATAAPGERRG